MNSKVMKIIKSIGSRILMILVTLLVILLVAEFITRTFSKIQPPLSIKDPKIGKKYSPNFSDKVYVEESHRFVHLKFNKDGFREIDRDYNKPKNTCRIAVLGDSQIAAIATHEKDTLVRQLEKILNQKHPQINWELFNFGISGASTAREFTLYKELASKYDPDIVICAYFLGNDFSDNCDRLSWNPRIYMNIDEHGELYKKPVSKKKRELSAWLNKNSRFYVWQKHKVNIALKKIALSKAIYRVRGGQLIFMNKDSDDLNYSWSLNEKLIHEFHKKVADDNRHFLFVIIPDCRQLYDDIWKAFYQKAQNEQEYLDADYPNKKLIEIAKNRDIDTIHLLDTLKTYINNQSSQNPDTQVGYGGTGHLNELGSLLSAQKIYSHLLENKLIFQMVDKYSHFSI